LKIPTLAELSAITLSATPTPAKKQKRAKSAEPAAGPEIASRPDRLTLEVFLDREQFSTGPIADEPGPDFTKILLFYEGSHEDAKDDASLDAKARAVVGNVFTRYKLRPEDFRFIAPPKAATIAVAKQPPVSARAHSGKPSPKPAAAGVAKPSPKPAVAGVTHLSYEEMIALRMLPYRSPWEFVAERFHCRETYLHTLNPKLPETPGAGSEFQVPNVIPFEIEKVFDQPLQPKADPDKPVTAVVIGLSELNIYQHGALIAVFPLSPARPGLHGRGTWTILDAIPHPRLATMQERTEQTRNPAPTGAVPQPTPSPSSPALSAEQYLAAGPRNPVGIVWINLAKSNSTGPLPYGLHGTSIPDQMNVEQSIGGFRLANWDIARAVHLLPSGTPLEWK
jgi:lipoprotein-anchoring transpeptidase ErfK/SrfK